MKPTRRDVLKTLAGGTALAWGGKAMRTAQASHESTQPAAGPIPKPEPRIERFERLAYGMFIHWGLYSQLGRGEWVMNQEKIPVEEYRRLRDTFTAADFDGRAIAGIVRRAGQRYATLTARHHEGFSLYDTRGLSDYDAVHSPAARDLVADFVEGCRAEGILPFFYHTTLDWCHPDFGADFDAYLDYLHASVEILCTQYGDIGGLWFDGNWSKPDADWKEDRLYGIIRKHQPEAMIINNTGIHKMGEIGHPEIDSTTFEQGRPSPMDRRGMPKYISAEMCQTMNMHWGIAINDYNYMSPPEIIENLCACRKVGANYLLNVGPTAGGAIPEYERAALERVGQWLERYGEAIYNGKPCSVAGPGPDFGLDVDGTLYLFVHALKPGHGQQAGEVSGPGPRTFEGVEQKVASVTWLDNGEELKFEQDGQKLNVTATGFPYGTNTVVRMARISQG
ncbi:MAG TPA: alpha-L-fucosidase [Candidatus Hydrogenedentes bacterium]|nr:alpha-L-fucosidase [Candidatus Hydrogenedentota bacterium]